MAKYFFKFPKSQNFAKFCHTVSLFQNQSGGEIKLKTFWIIFRRYQDVDDRRRRPGRDILQPKCVANGSQNENRKESNAKAQLTSNLCTYPSSQSYKQFMTLETQCTDYDSRVIKYHRNLFLRLATCRIASTQKMLLIEFFY